MSSLQEILDDCEDTELKNASINYDPFCNENSDQYMMEHMVYFNPLLAGLV
jgi:hypothetical protein